MYPEPSIYNPQARGNGLTEPVQTLIGDLVDLNEIVQEIYDTLNINVPMQSDSTKPVALDRVMSGKELVKSIRNKIVEIKLVVKSL